ncbi:hypothetical protein [Rhodococcus sp. NPDC057529]|uniref:hypothetical protein n=1 Tax=Rhodococcus sp. NPDC057529 TaxID=3346158 RepID=UPI00366E2783
MDDGGQRDRRAVPVRQLSPHSAEVRAQELIAAEPGVVWVHRHRHRARTYKSSPEHVVDGLVPRRDGNRGGGGGVCDGIEHYGVGFISELHSCGWLAELNVAPHSRADHSCASVMCSTTYAAPGTAERTVSGRLSLGSGVASDTVSSANAACTCPNLDNTHSVCAGDRVQQIVDRRVADRDLEARDMTSEVSVVLKVLVVADFTILLT